MDKVKKQVAVNTAMVVISVIIIIFAKSISANKLVGWEDWLGSDLLFVLITSLVTMVGWRFAESIVVHYIYNICVALFIFLFSVEYGFSLSAQSSFLQSCIFISAFVYLALYSIENVLIIRFFKSNIVNQKVDSLGYKRKG